MGCISDSELSREPASRGKTDWLFPGSSKIICTCLGTPKFWFEGVWPEILARRAGGPPAPRCQKNLPHPFQARWALALVVVLSELGCGTTRWTDTQRTLTEQWLVSDAIDQAVSQIDFTVLKDKTVFVDSQYVDLLVVDKGYLISSVRQVLLASRCLLQEDRNKATYVIELRSGGIGTDRHDVLFGIPQMNIPTFYLTQGLPAQTPEIAFAKSTKQIGGAKIEVFAYNRLTGQPVWQSGMAQHTSLSKHRWVAGIGPFQSGTILNGTKLAGEPIPIPFFGEKQSEGATGNQYVVPVTHEAVWNQEVVRGGALRLSRGEPILPPISTLPTLETLSERNTQDSAEPPLLLAPAGISRPPSGTVPPGISNAGSSSSPGGPSNAQKKSLTK